MRLRSVLPRFLAVGLAVCVTTVGLPATPSFAAGSASAGAGPSFVEPGYQNPVTALPPVSRPDTPHCVVTAMQHDFANSYGQPFTSTLAPPADCPGPWSKVVLDWSGSVAGRQYDRLAGVWIGGSEVFRTSTPEPDPAGISWHVDADLSQYIPLLRSPQPLVVDLGNIYNSTYTGIYHMTMTVTYYQADRRHPEASHPDVVVPVSQSTTGAGWWNLTAGTTATATVTVPRNITSAHMQVYARGGGCEEFWYSNVPDSYAAAHPSYGLCGGGSYREVGVAVDGKLAGIAQPFPVIYTGGITPYLWRPIPSIDAFHTLPYDVDLTPFAGLLTDGKPHTITLIPPAGISDGWLIDGSLLLNTDAHRAQTTGGLLQDTVQAAPTITSSQTTDGSGDDVLSETAHRDYVVSGYLETSHGRVVTTVTQHTTYSNTDTVASLGTVQTVRQRDAGWTRSDADGPGARQDGSYLDTWSYPIDMSSTFVPSPTGAGFTVQGTVDVTRLLSASGHGTEPAFTDDQVKAKGVQQRDDAGNLVQGDGSGSEHYVGTDDRGRWYDHYIAANHGYVTEDRIR